MRTAMSVWTMRETDLSFGLASISGADQRGIAEKQEFAGGMALQRQFRSGDDHGRTVIAPHRIESNADLVRHLATQVR